MHDRLKEARVELVELKTDLKDAEDRVKNIDDELAQLENIEQTAEVLDEKKRLQNLQTALATSLSKFMEAVTQKKAKIDTLEQDIDNLQSGIGNYFTCISIRFG